MRHFPAPSIGLSAIERWLRDSPIDSCLTRDGEAVYLPVHPGWPPARAYVAALTGRGFAVADGDAPLREIWDACRQVPVTVSMEGSHWNHAFLASAEDALHVTINPADRFNNISADFVMGTPGRLATTVARPEEGGYRVNIVTLLGLIDGAGGV